MRRASLACSTRGAASSSTIPTATHGVPGGALSSEDGAWHAASSGFFLPVHALSKIFLTKLRDRMYRAGLLAQIPAEAWQQDWNVHCQAVPNAEASIQYLAPYVFKVAISDHRIVRIEDGLVTFSYHKPGSARPRTLTLDALEFMRRFLTHVLPSGFMKVRYYGFLCPTAKVSLDEVKTMVQLAHGFAVSTPDAELPPWPQPACQVCGGCLRYLKSLRAHAAPLPPVSVPACGWRSLNTT
jgi:Putative transposase